MSLRWLNIFFLIAGIIIISCSDPVVQTRQLENIDQSAPPEKITPVQKLQNRSQQIDLTEISRNETAIIEPIPSTKKIGEIVDRHITGVPAKKMQLENKVWTNIFYSPANRPVKIKSKGQINIVFDNDIFDNRDYYYTNGFRIDLIAPFVSHSPIKHILIGSKKAQIEFNGFSLRQNIYTPTNPDVEEILVGDRPFSAYLTIGQFREVYDLRRKIHIKSELNIGVIGSVSMGGQVQAQIHEIEPVGWPNQIRNDIIIDYHLEYHKGIISSPLVEFNAMGKANVGTLYNKIGGGLNMRLGHFMPVYQGPLSVFEFINPGARLQFWFFLKGEVNVIAYDATLQGGLFNRDNPYVIKSEDINRWVFQSSMGFAIYYNNVGLEYEHFYQTPEFKGAYHFGWGRLKAVIAF